MRSRYAGFALGLGDYLVRTLAPSHPDAALPAGDLARQMASQRERQRFQGLTILHTEDTADGGEVLFVARIFERGADRSFAELSRFERVGGAFRYASGVLVAGDRLPRDLATLDRASFLALAAADA